jgi:hypothetical protein
MQMAGDAIDERLTLIKEFSQLYRNQNGNTLLILFADCGQA